MNINFEVAVSKDWNSLPRQIKKVTVLSRFKRELYFTDFEKKNRLFAV